MVLKDIFGPITHWRLILMDRGNILNTLVCNVILMLYLHFTIAFMFWMSLFSIVLCLSAR